MRVLFAFIVLASAGTLTPQARAATHAVSDCGDSGPGTLRSLVATAMDGDTIDASACFEIALSSGQLVIPQDNLEIVGAANLTPFIGASLRSRLLRHYGNGTLRLRSLHLGDGHIAAPVAAGGCVYSPGHVELVGVVVGNCDATSVGEAGSAYGGNIYAKSVTATRSTIHSGKAVGNGSHGGGIATEGRLTLYRSRVTGNAAHDGGGVFTLGGASVTYSTFLGNIAANDDAALEALGGDVTINKSLFTNNRASGGCGAVCVYGSGRTVVLNSTISGNEASYLAAGRLSDDAAVSSSTIVFNTSLSTNQCTGALRARHLRLESSIVANNNCRASQPNYDIGGSVAAGYTLTGSNNLVRLSRIPLPADTITASPMVQSSLLDDGGPTPTHPLLRGSPALDAGNNTAGQQYDQRGPGFPRVLGLRADIGAHEGTCAD